jgi:hypothetical protein
MTDPVMQAGSVFIQPGLFLYGPVWHHKIVELYF